MKVELNQEKWLPHLTSTVVSDARGWNLDAYVIALEGWRRGLTLKWHTKDLDKFKEMKTWFVDTPGRLFSLSSSSRTHYFFRTRGDLVPNEAVEIGSDKFKTKQVLASLNIPIPKGKSFDQQADQSTIVAYAEALGYPIVIKPIDGSFGRGVFTNVMSEVELIEGLKYIRTTLQEQEVIVEKHVTGKEYRMYVVNDQVVGAINRIPANIMGDGLRTISTLIRDKNKQRGLNPRLFSCPIVVNDELNRFIEFKGYTIHDVPKKNEKVYLNDKSNISQGGDSIDVLDELPNEIKRTAIEALQAIPGLHHGAVDLIIDQNETDISRAGTVLELNPTSQIGSLIFPMTGIARDIPAAIIDYYFPETANQSYSNHQMYFGFTESIAPLTKRVANTVQVTELTAEKVEAERIDISVWTSDDNKALERYIKRIAVRSKISGKVKGTESNGIQIIAAGTRDNLNCFRDRLEAIQSKFNFSIEEISRHLESVRLGFTIKSEKGFYINSIRDSERIAMNLVSEKAKLEKRYRQMLASNSWKVTAPVRKITGVLKRK